MTKCGIPFFGYPSYRENTDLKTTGTPGAMAPSPAQRAEFPRLRIPMAEIHRHRSLRGLSFTPLRSQAARAASRPAPLPGTPSAGLRSVSSPIPPLFLMSSAWPLASVISSHRQSNYREHTWQRPKTHHQALDNT